MPTHAELAAKLLFDASTFFKTLGEQNEPLQEQMNENADVFEQMANLIATDPSGELENASYAELSGKLLKDSANFFRTLAEQNEPLKEQMLENANVYDQIADLVTERPLAELETPAE